MLNVVWILHETKLFSSDGLKLFLSLAIIAITPSIIVALIENDVWLMLFINVHGLCCSLLEVIVQLASEIERFVLKRISNQIGYLRERSVCEGFLDARISKLVRSWSIEGLILKLLLILLLLTMATLSILTLVQNHHCPNILRRSSLTKKGSCL